MKKYTFRLQTVLDIKVNKLNEKLVELAQVQQILSAEEEKLANLKSRKNVAYEELIQIYSLEKALDIQEVCNYKGFLGKIEIEIKQQEDRIENVMFFVKQKQTEVNQALKEKKILEKLKEKEKNAYYQEFIKQEAKELDDLASTRHVRLAS
ncbi:flagellar export protein FliJ [bacterium]|nr:flagellar export protein FliJ [bacterium]